MIPGPRGIMRISENVSAFLLKEKAGLRDKDRRARVSKIGGNKDRGNMHKASIIGGHKARAQAMAEVSSKGQWEVMIKIGTAHTQVSVLPAPTGHRQGRVRVVDDSIITGIQLHLHAGKTEKLMQKKSRIK